MSSSVLSQFLINREELKRVLEAPNDDAEVAIRISFTRTGRPRRFRITVRAARSQEPRDRSVFCEYNFPRRKLLTMVTRAQGTTFIAIKTIMSIQGGEESVSVIAKPHQPPTPIEEEVEGCPNPPSCYFPE